MENPWLSVWLSEYNRYSEAAKDQMMAEATRQQKALMSVWTEQMVETWMALWMPWAAGKSKKKR